MKKDPLPSIRSLFTPRLAAWAAAICLAWSAPGAWAQKAVTASPEARSFKLGTFELTSLRDNSFEIANNGSVFGLNASVDEVAKVLKEAGASPDSLRLDCDALLVRMSGHVVLFDTGTGAHGVLMQSLTSAGQTAAGITDIFITHSHGDHIGGLVDAAGKSAFPNATIRMSSREWTHLKEQESNHALVDAIQAQVKAFEPGTPVLPGVTPVALYGHTPGHVVYEIESEGRKLVDVGDTVHSAIISLAKPGWTMQFDGDKQLGVQQREKELRQLAGSQALIFAPHFPFPGVGRIEPAGDGFSFKPDVPPDE